MSIDAENITRSGQAFASAHAAVDALARAMAEAQAPNGGAACMMYLTHARQHLLEAVSALDGRHRTVTLPALPRLPAPLQYESR